MFGSGFLMSLGMKGLRFGSLQKLRRKYKRCRVNHLIRYRDAECPESDFAPQGIANLHNISLGGLQFHTHIPAAVHTLLRIDIQVVGNGVVIPVVAETVWSERIRKGKGFYYRVGVAFREIDEKYEDLIRVMATKSLAA